MDPKKNIFLFKLREKAKPLFNVKIGKKGKKSPLKYRRSISVPDMLCTQSALYFGESDVQSSDNDSSSFTSVVHSPGYAYGETSSLACSESFTVPNTEFSSKYLDTLTVSNPLASAVSVEQLNSPNTTSSAPVQDSVTMTNPSSLNIYPVSDRPAVMDVPLTKDRLYKQPEEKDKNTKWYIEDSESTCSTPLEVRSYNFFSPEQDLAEDIEPVTPVSTDMFIIGSAENMNEIFNETNDFDTSFSGKKNESGASSEPQIVPSGQKVQYLLTINLKEGRNLVVRDRSGTSDPYVKFKVDGKTVYKSKVVYKNLNPTWNECFSFLVKDLEQIVYVKVYDRDFRSRDFMGSSAINLSSFELDKTCEMILHLKEPGSLVEDMGVIILDASVSIFEGPTKRNKWQLKRKGSFGKGQGRTIAIQKSQVWNTVYTVVLVEGQDMPDTGQGDVFVRFRLGEQRFRSKNVCVKANPQWREMFDFNRFEDGQQDVLLVEVLYKKGRKYEECCAMYEVDLSQLHMNKTHTYSLSAGKGRLVFLVTATPCSGVSISEIVSTSSDSSYNYESIVEQYGLRSTLKNIKDVGYLQVKVLKATELSSTDLNGKSDPFCVLELGNNKLQTQTIYKTVHPEWKTVFTLPIKDIHEVLVLTVFGEDGDKAPDFLGKVVIPLLTISNGQQITSLLRKEDLVTPCKGTITLEMNVFYNPVRAAIRTFQPKETKLEEDIPKFNKKLLARNIYRVRRISMAVLYTLQYIKSCFHWENTKRSSIAFLLYVVMVWHFEPFMLPLFLLLLIGWNYFYNTPGVGSPSQDLENMSAAEDEDEDEKESEKRGLREKIHMVQDIVLTVQQYLDEVASIGERVKNTFNWSVPFMSILACIVLLVATTTLYYIPFRYVALLWGVNKFTKRFRNPHAIENYEILDFLNRVPSDVQKVQYGELKAPSIQSAQKKKR